ncbi:hypothetical protein ACS0TY_027067 [Phlomoides rotata]
MGSEPFSSTVLGHWVIADRIDLFAMCHRLSMVSWPHSVRCDFLDSYNLDEIRVLCGRKGILIVDQTKATWDNIAEDVKSAISAYDEEFDKILSLSYTRLPHHLRPCFLYMGGFPEDYKMSASKLIRLWVAEGFLIPNGNNKSFEETTEEYLEDLVNRSLVSVTKRKSNGRIKIISMYDLMREMCTRKAKEENFILYLSGLFTCREDTCVDYHLHNLIHLQQLETLKLEMHEFPFELKHNVAFPGTLKKLTLSGLGLAWEDIAIVGSFHSLEVLKLRYDACVGDSWETTEGEFSQLKFLLINHSQLQHWITESSHFPRLKCLVLRYCHCLKEIPDGIGEIDTLELIKVVGLKSMEDSAKQIREDQLTNSGYSALQD